MKHCNTCNTNKSDDQFHKRAASVDGLAARCRDCQRIYDKARANKPDRVQARAEYAKSEAGIKAGNRAKRAWAHRNKDKVYEIGRAYIETNPKKAKVHGIVGYAIRLGKLKAEPCEACGETSHVHAHHDDYDKPVDVRWLCSAHHRSWHAEYGEGLNAH